VVSIEAGNRGNNLQFRLPGDENRQRLSGRVRFADGVPVANASVTFTSPEHGYSETTSTGSDGSFSLPVVAGWQGQLTGRLVVFEFMLGACPQFQSSRRGDGMLRLIDAPSLSLSSDVDHENITLELPSPSCKSWPPTRN
jgi:hypothetical protein